MARLVIPPECKTFESAMEFVQLAREKLRRLHNEMGHQPPSVFIPWVAAEFKPRNHAITDAELALRVEAKISDAEDYRSLDEAARALGSDSAEFSRVDLTEDFVGLEPKALGLDPLEDFTGYTEVDPNSNITVTADLLDINSVTEWANAYVYADKDADHFGATFEHNFRFVHQGHSDEDNGDVTRFAVYAVSNTISDASVLNGGATQSILAYVYTTDTSSSWYLYLRSSETSSTDNTSGIAANVGVSFYPTVERTSETAAELRLYTDSGRTSLHDTLTVTVTDGRRFRYIYGCASWYSQAYSYPTLSMDVGDLDLQEAAGDTVSPDGIGGAEAFGTAQLNQTITPSGIASAEAFGTPNFTGTVSLTAQGIASAEALGTPGIVMALAPGGVAGAEAFGAPQINQTINPGGIASAETFGDSQALELWPVSISIPDLNGTRRRLSWDTEGDVYVSLDGVLYQKSTGVGYADVDESETVRQYIEIADQVRNYPITPLDRVQLDWTATGVTYEVWRKKGAGDWTQIATTSALLLINGPLTDDTYRYKIIALDAEGDESNTVDYEEVTISSAPEPPTGLAFSFDDETGTLTLSWTASTSADVASYPVRSNAGSGPILLSDTPVQDTGALTYEKVFTTETGLWLFNIHAKDSDGKEEANVSQIVALSFESGSPEALPAWPLRVKAEAITGGKVQVSWWYRPDQEYLGPGAAYEARIYYDNGTGTVSYAAPLDTLLMDGPEDPDVWEWESDALVDDQEYLFVVRIATAAHPGGVETQNTDEHAATPNSDVPDVPVLTATVV